jgi:molybdopterin synthase sulfur carrier subunit
MKIRIKAFATVKDICGFDEKDITINDDISVNEMLNLLEKDHPSLRESRGKLLYAINDEYVNEEVFLNDSDILAIFPPVSGG